VRHVVKHLCCARSLRGSPRHELLSALPRSVRADARCDLVIPLSSGVLVDQRGAPWRVAHPRHRFLDARPGGGRQVVAELDGSWIEASSRRPPPSSACDRRTRTSPASKVCPPRNAAPQVDRSMAPPFTGWNPRSVPSPWPARNAWPLPRMTDSSSVRANPSQRRCVSTCSNRSAARTTTVTPTTGGRRSTTVLRS
jgi:hypothetical protein